MTVRELLNRFRDRLRRDVLSAELDEELRMHAQLAARDQRRLANITRLREDTRDMWTLGILDDLLHDLRYATRLLGRNVSFTVAVVLTLALGIGANTAIFSVVHAVLLRPLPYADPTRLFSVWEVPTGSPNNRYSASYLDIVDWRRQSRALSGIAGFGYNRYELSGTEGVEQARAVIGMPTLYDIIGARPIIGRMPRDDEQHLPVVALSYRLWQRRYAGNPNIVGRTVLLDHKPFTIVGVLPAGFHFPTPDIDLWTSFQPITDMTSQAPGAPNPWTTKRSLHAFRVVARLAPGVTSAQAESEMNAIDARLAAAYPDEDGGRRIRLQSVRNAAVKDVERALWTMLGAAGLVLLLGCVNVAHLLLARMSARRREIAVRRALGAHRGRVARQLIAESVLLAGVGGVAGVGVAVVATRLLVRFGPSDIPRLETVGLDVTTLAFAIVVSIVTGLVFGVAPAMFAWRSDPQDALREQSRGSIAGRAAARARSVLTAAEVALAVVLLVGAGLMIRSFARLVSADIGVQPDRVLAFHVTMSNDRYPGDGAKVRVVDRMLADLRAIPGVAAVGASTSMPPSRMQETAGFAIEGQPAPMPGHEPEAIFVPATAGFNDALGIALVQGRWFTSGDDSSGAPVAIVSRELARRHFANGNAIGHRIAVNGSSRVIVGVVTDAAYEGVGAPLTPQVYVPFAQRVWPGVWVAVKSVGDPSAVMTSVRAAMERIDPELDARELQPLNGLVGASVLRPRFQTWLIGTFGGLALLLATIGIYGVIAYGVAQRTSEIGLRLALGATTRNVLALVLRGGMMPVIAGLTAGLAAAFAFSRVMVSLLYEVTPTDLSTFLGVSAVLMASALLAAYLPARRAASIDPSSAMRAD
ncbi:MAG TPA: ABC transporter permease [Gemmatimonadaceae bacterium]